MTSRDRPEREGDVRFPLQLTPDMISAGVRVVESYPAFTGLQATAEMLVRDLFAAILDCSSPES